MSDANPRNTRVFLSIPNYGDVSHATWDAIHNAMWDSKGPRVHAFRNHHSLLAYNFNQCFAECINTGGFHYFAMIHADVGASEGWLATLIGEAVAGDFDVMHAPVPIKTDCGLTSTAVAYSDDEWAIVRRIATKELRSLPPTFGIEEVRVEMGANAVRLLPNTGCMIIRLGDWVSRFPGFQIADRLVVDNGKMRARVVSEDWAFGHWCDRNGLKVGATTKVVTQHWGRVPYMNNREWGVESDTNWATQQEEIVCLQ